MLTRVLGPNRCKTGQVSEPDSAYFPRKSNGYLGYPLTSKCSPLPYHSNQMSRVFNALDWFLDSVRYDSAFRHQSFAPTS
jgi:hypothetical protein